MLKRMYAFLITIIFLLGVITPVSAAAGVTPVVPPPDGKVVVAELTIFADIDSGSSSDNTISSLFGRHAFITIKNTSSSPIQTGTMTGVASGKTVSIGTWGNKEEHDGIWYNLEEYYISIGEYSNRVSLKMNLSSGELATVNSIIKNNDSYTVTSNHCGTFAAKVWNSVAGIQVTSGTPKTIFESIKGKSGYKVKDAVPLDYLVHYGNGTSSPKRSQKF